MRNGFGLKFLHKFLNLPFLTLQRQSILKQLETNQREMEATLQELDIYLESNEADYEVYSSGVTHKRRAQAESLAPKATVDVVVGQPSNTFKELQQPKKLTPMEKSKPVLLNQEPSPPPPPPKPTSSKIDNVDDFVPDSQTAIENFLDDNDPNSPTKLSKMSLDDNVSDDDSQIQINPKVASFNEDVEVDDYKSSGINLQDLSSSSDDNEEAKAAVAKVKVTKVKVKAKLSNSSLKSNSEDSSLHFELPAHLQMSEALDPLEPLEPDEVGKKKAKKSKKPKEKKAKKHKERNELEEFLNGTPPSTKDEGTYEEL